MVRLGHSVTIPNASAWVLCPLARHNGFPTLPSLALRAGRVIPLHCALHPPFSPKGRVAAAVLCNLKPMKGQRNGKGI